MKGIFDVDHTELAPPLQGEGCWYLPVFGVYHLKKRDQIRGVFHSSAKYNGFSLNNLLVTGPDLNNSLLGILLRFRPGTVAVMADIQQMLYCFKVKGEHRNFPWFSWFRDNDPEKDLVEYRMCVHIIFRNSPSPAVATYGSKLTAQVWERTFGTDMREFVTKNFYLDYGLISLLASEQIVDLVKQTQQALLHEGNLRLHKIASNSERVMNSFPTVDLAKELQNLYLDKDIAPVQRSLGIKWDMKSDTFTFGVCREKRPDTRRGILSTVNSLYDPIGFIAPVTIQGKLFLRDLLSTTTDCDMPLPEESVISWQQWKDSLGALDDVRILRSYSSAAPTTDRRELHVFAGASENTQHSAALCLFLKNILPLELNIKLQ